MTETTLRRPTLADTFRAVGGLLRRKGLVLAALALGLNGGLQWIGRAMQHAEVFGRFDAMRTGVSPTLGHWFGLALGSGVVAALSLNDLKGESVTPRVVGLKTIMRWPALLLVTAGLELPRLLGLAAMMAIMANPYGNPTPLTMLVGGSWLLVFAFAVLLALAIPVLMQERGGPIRALWRGWSLSKGARVTLFVLALAWQTAASAVAWAVPRLSGSLVVAEILDIASQALLSGLWVCALAAVYLQQRGALGPIPQARIGEVFD